MIGMPEKQEFVPGTGEHPLHADTVYSIEFSVAADIPEWATSRCRPGSRRGGLHGRRRALGGRLPRAFYLIR